MSDEAIPEDVMKAAQDVMKNLHFEASWEHVDPIEIAERFVAKAILAERAAERERCAKVATDTGKRLGEPAIGHAIASSIRSSHE